MKINADTLCRCKAVFLAVFLVTPTTSWADVRPVKNTVRMSNVQNGKNCVDEAINKGVVLSLKQVANSLKLDGNDSGLLSELLQDGDVVETQHEVKNEGEGACVVTVLVRVDTTRLKQKFLENANKSVGGAMAQKSRVGSLIRFLVNGKPVEQSGGDSRSASMKLEKELLDYGIQLVSLDRFAETYQNKSIGMRTPVHQREQRKQVGSSAMEATVAEQLNDAQKIALSNMGMTELGSFDFLVSGQVLVDPPVENPDGPGYLAEVTTYIGFKDFKSSDPFGADSRHGRALGSTKKDAINNAMEESVEGVVKTIATQAKARLDRDDKIGSSFSLQFENVKNELRQVFAVQEELEEKGVSITTKNDSGGGRSRVVKMGVNFHGSVVEFEKVIKKTLLKQSDPPKDILINGSLVRIIY